MDAHKLQSVFVNILQNGIDAIEDDGDIQISMSRRIRESSAMIGGSGDCDSIFRHRHPESALPKIFDPFTTKEPGKGMGLGLSLCHRIIESFHGEIDVKSAPGKGTDVTVSCRPPEKTRRPTRARRLCNVRKDETTRRQRILVIDDEENIRYMLQLTLEDEAT